MSRLQFEGRSAAEAAIKACEKLGTTRSQLKYEVVSDTGTGLERKVTIAVDENSVSAKAPAAVNGAGGAHDDDLEEAPRRDSTFERGDRYESRGGSRDRGGDRGGERGGRRGGRGRDRDSRGGGERGPRRGGGRGFRDNEQQNDDGIESLLGLEPITQAQAPTRPDLEKFGVKATAARDHLNKVLSLLKMQASSHVVQDDEQEVHLEIRGENAGTLAGKKGEPLLSLQFLLNRMASQGGENEQVVVLDVAGYRERRRLALAELAKRLAKRALEERKVVKLSPMSAHDRRVFHVTLSEMGGVTTRSEGDGLYRRLLIIPSEFSAN